MLSPNPCLASPRPARLFRRNPLYGTNLIAFMAEHRAAPQTWLEWQGVYDGRPTPGVTNPLTALNAAVR